MPNSCLWSNISTLKFFTWYLHTFSIGFQMLNIRRDWFSLFYVPCHWVTAMLVSELFKNRREGGLIMSLPSAEFPFQQDYTSPPQIVSLQSFVCLCTLLFFPNFGFCFFPSCPTPCFRGSGGTWITLFLDDTNLLTFKLPLSPTTYASVYKVGEEGSQQVGHISLWLSSTYSWLNKLYIYVYYNSELTLN